MASHYYCLLAVLLIFSFSIFHSIIIISIFNFTIAIQVSVLQRILMIGDSYIRMQDAYNEKIIDLRSDVVSRAPKQMLQLMAKAETGDDVYDDDPTINAFQEKIAQYFGFEDALLMPSTTMGNLIAVLLWTKPGDEVIIWGSSHSAQRQSCGMAKIGGVQTRQILSQSGVLKLSQIQSKVRKESHHITYPDTNLIFIENPTFSGQVWPLQTLKTLKQFGSKEDIRIHCDGARAFNALDFYQCNPKQFGKLYDSMTLCLSKGLCCPFGSVLFVNKGVIKKAKQLRKSIGGGMRQVGIIGAAGMYALKNGLQIAKNDNKMAKILAFQLEKIPGIKINKEKVQINMVNFKIQIQNFDHENFIKYLKDNDVLMKAMNIEKQMYRIVIHRTVREEQIKKFMDLMKNYVKL